MLGFVPSLLVRGGLSVEQAGVLLGLSTLVMIGSVLLGGASAQWLARPGMGLFYTGYYLGMTLLPPVAGWLQDVFGGSAALYFAAAAVLATLPFYIAFRALSSSREGPIAGADRARQA